MQYNHTTDITALVINNGDTAFVYGHGYFIKEGLPSDTPKVEIEASERVSVVAGELNEDNTVVITDHGTYYSRNEAEFDYDAWITAFIVAGEASGSVSLENWELFSDIYKDARGIRPRAEFYTFDIV